MESCRGIILSSLGFQVFRVNTNNLLLNVVRMMTREVQNRRSLEIDESMRFWKVKTKVGVKNICTAA